MNKFTDYLKNKHSRLEIMKGKEKGDVQDLLDKEIHINNFDFLNGDDGEYAVFTIVEDDKQFYFASSVLTNELKDIENDGMKDDAIEETIAIKLYERKSKNGKRTYIAVEYVD